MKSQHREKVYAKYNKFIRNVKVLSIVKVDIVPKYNFFPNFPVLLPSIIEYILTIVTFIPTIF